MVYSDNKGNEVSFSVIVSCFLAGMLEMYDFLIFGFLTSVIYKNYLSFLDQGTAQIITYIFFAIGFLFRPLGSIIFGQIGDRYGRKIALVLSVSFMGVASLSMALLPPYELIGITACYLIVVIRIVQGLSVGGEYSGAIIYAMEHINKKNLGLVGGTVLCGCVLGVFLAFIVSSTLQSELLPEYSWRFAFLFGFGLSLVGYFIRKKLKETPLFQDNNTQKLKIPLVYGFKKYKLKMLSTVFLSGASNANFYFAVIFVPNYLKNNKLINTEFSGLFLISVMFCVIPFIGWFCDKWSRKNIMILSTLLIGVYNLFFLTIITNGSTVELINTYTAIYAILLSLLLVVANVFVLEAFPVNCRFSCGATSYSVGAALFGGTAPIICSLIVKTYEYNSQYVSIYISCISFLGALGVMGLFYKNLEIKDNIATQQVSGLKPMLN